MLQGLDEAIAALAAIDLDTLPDDELHDVVLGLHESCSRLAAEQARFLARWDARMVWADDGSQGSGSAVGA
jgi:hypothetical protein